MHTLEHILNATMDKMFGCGRAFGSHIESKKSKCDYRFDRELTEGEISELTSRINKVIGENLAVTESFTSLEEAARRFNLERLPDDAGDTLRIVSIGDYDHCPCIGQHAANTSELDPIRIISTGYENGVLRVRFKFES